ncbi:Ubiquitin-conjugating enzyme E2 W [Spraguea lophii 42_110]|uniref:Ubiquitin-conjugating enzyme E2 W n=1 Tax=Spraguea lophii (strain 42_110) TaxID=1358809 RepID=S7W6A8_SPRLO|nr:Ubiquitin-conjugating enzyme E2 W [Spraguea lophii 42_110]
MNKRLSRELQLLEEEPCDYFTIIKITITNDNKDNIFYINNEEMEKYTMMNKTNTNKHNKKISKNKKQNISTLIIKLPGPPGSIYTKEIFYLKIVIPQYYPITRPCVKFTNTHIPVNEHVYSNGCICISTLYDNWSPANTIRTIVLSIMLLLADAKEKKKPLDDIFMSKKKDPNDCKWIYHDEI